VTAPVVVNLTPVDAVPTVRELLKVDAPETDKVLVVEMLPMKVFAPLPPFWTNLVA